MSKREMIDLTGIELSNIVKAAYECSKPQGMGFIHFEPGSLDETEVSRILSSSRSTNDRLSMDYVKGRAVKLQVYPFNGDKGDEPAKMVMNASWYDHSDHDVDMLCKKLGIDRQERTLTCRD